MATLTAYTFGTRHDIENPEVRWQLEVVSHIASRGHELWSTNGLKLDRHFTHPP